MPMVLSPKQPVQGRRRNRGPGGNPGGLVAQGNANIPTGMNGRRMFSMGSSSVGSNLRGGRAQQDIVEFDEYIAEISGTTSTSVPGVTKYPIQPGLALTFPEGSVEAALWTEWRMVGCEFYYKREVSEFAANGTTGKVILSVDYNPANPAPTTKQQLEIMPHTDFMPCENAGLRIDPQCVNRADCKFIRTGQVPAGEDVKTFDGGNLWVATLGNAGTGVLGELHCRYRFHVEKPTLLNANVSTQVRSSSFYTQHAATTYTTATPKATVFDSLWFDGLVIGAPSAAGVFTPPAGAYRITAMVSLQDTSNEAFSATLQFYKNGAAITSPFNGPVSKFANPGAPGGSSNNSLSSQIVITCNGTDTIQAEVTATGAGGALTSPADEASILFELA